MFVIMQTEVFDVNVFAYIWANKWIGEFISIVFLTPILLFLLPNPFVRQARKPFAAIITTITVLSVINIIFLLSSHNTFKEKESQFNETTQPFIEYLNILQATIRQNLSALDGLLQVKDHLTKSQFQVFANKLHSNNLNARAIAWLPLIKHEQRNNFEAQLSEDEGTVSHIMQFRENGITIAEHADYYIPIHYIAPYDENKQAVGLDIASHPIVKHAAAQAISTGEPILSPLLSLAQQQDKFTGVIVYSPVYKQSSSSESPAIYGLVEIVFEIDLLLERAFKQSDSKDFTYQLTYGNRNIVASPLFSDDAFFHRTVEITIFDKQGILNLASTKPFEKELINWLGLIIIVVCCVIGVICVMFVFFIVTFNASLKKKIAISTKKLTEKNDELTKANQAKNLFLANISHEYRTPLNAIIGFTEIARREVAEKKAIEYFNQINESSNILLGIVNDVLDTSKIQAGELSLEKHPFNPATATQAVVDMLQEKAAEKQLAIITEFSDEFNIWLAGDITRFKQIVINLLSNAIKFTRQGEIKISGHCQPLANNLQEVKISVKDSGIGISADAHQRLFEPFAQAENATTRKYGGTGLGLSIVKQLSVMMGGDVTLISEEGKGSEFTVTLSLTTEQPQANASNTVTNQTICFSQLNVLIVEDNKINQKVAQKQLSALGISSDIADDGYQALMYLETNKPDLILMDLQMPNIDGFTASGLIKSNEALTDIPIVILSASVGQEEKEKAAALGITDFINKPFQQANLINVLNKYFPQT